MCDKQLTGYTFIAYGAVGDQPGQHAWHYLEPWQTLPDGTFIASWKFTAARPSVCHGADIPVPPMHDFWFHQRADSVSDGGLAAGWSLPCIAFNYLGQLTPDGQNPAGQHEYIPLARGSVMPAMDPTTKTLQFSPAGRVGNAARQQHQLRLQHG